MSGESGTGAQRPSSLGPSAARTYSQKQTLGFSRSPYNAINHARRTRCPNFGGSYIWSLSTDRAAQLACGRWDCGWCQRRKRAAARMVIDRGIQMAWTRGERLRFMTLTDGRSGAMTVADLYAAWNKLRTRLTRDRSDGRYVTGYAAVVEVQKRGALHLHVLTTGRYIPQKQLVGMARAAGFGRCTDIREVKHTASEDSTESAMYVTKQLAGYLTKQEVAALSAKTAVRRRPLRTSHGWAGGLTLTKAEAWLGDQIREEVGATKDEGPFAFVQVLADGGYWIRGREDTDDARDPAGVTVGASSSGRFDRDPVVFAASLELAVEGQDGGDRSEPVERNCCTEVDRVERPNFGGLDLLRRAKSGACDVKQPHVLQQRVSLGLT